MQKEIGWLLKEKYGGNPTNSFYNDIKRLEAGEPLDYVIGFTEFGVPPGSCKIDLSKKPLIPRSETEFWVEKAIKEIKKNKKRGLRCLDIFSGSGCVGVAVLKNTSSLLCDISEKDKKLLGQIKINLKINKIKLNRYKVIQSDIFENIKGKYDFILANPPYIAKNKKNKIKESVLKYEPKQALFGGEDGFLYINKFLRQAKNHLNPDGKIFMEFDSPQKKGIKDLIEKIGYTGCEFGRDQYGKWRYTVIKL